MASRADVALYAIMCSLAVFDRQKVRTEIVERPNLGSFLEHEPHARELLDSFYACDYKRTLELLDLHEARYLVDVHLAPHFQDLRRSITDRAMLQFIQPFDAVKLERIEAAIWSDDGQGGARAANKVLDLIQQGRIDGKVDWINKVVNVRKPDVRQELFEETLKSGQERIEAARRLIFRMNVVQNGCVDREASCTFLHQLVHTDIQLQPDRQNAHRSSRPLETVREILNHVICTILHKRTTTNHSFATLSHEHCV